MSPAPNTDNKINRFVTSFAFAPAPITALQPVTNPVRATATHKNSAHVTNKSFASNLYRDARNAKPALYPDGKTCAIPSLHRDKFSAKVPGPYPVRRQVAPTNFIAGPLAVMVRKKTDTEIGQIK